MEAGGPWEDYAQPAAAAPTGGPWEDYAQHPAAPLREVAADSALYVDYADTPRAARMLEQACADTAGRARLTAAGIERSKDFSFERLARERVGAMLSAIGTPLG